MNSRGTRDRNVTRLEKRIREKKDCQTEQVLCVRQMQIFVQIVQLRRYGREEDIKVSKAYASRGGGTHLGIADTRPVEKCE